ASRRSSITNGSTRPRTPPSRPHAAMTQPGAGCSCARWPTCSVSGCQRGEHVVHDRFAEFVTTPPLKGLGRTVDLVRRRAAGDMEALDVLDQALQEGGRQGERTDLLDNAQEVVQPPAPTGTSRDRALRRLRKDAPELHADVLAGRLTAHRAMVTAGF